MENGSPVFGGTLPLRQCAEFRKRNGEVAKWCVFDCLLRIGDRVWSLGPDKRMFLKTSNFESACG